MPDEDTLLPLLCDCGVDDSEFALLPASFFVLFFVDFFIADLGSVADADAARTDSPDAKPFVAAAM